MKIRNRPIAAKYVGHWTVATAAKVRHGSIATEYVGHWPIAAVEIWNRSIATTHIGHGTVTPTGRRRGNASSGKKYCQESNCYCIPRHDPSE